MNFQDQVSRIMYLEVQRYKGKFSFGATFLDHDNILFSIRTHKEFTRDIRSVRHPDYPANVIGKKHYSSVRVFHINRPNDLNLSSGQVWKCEIAKCYHDPDEPLTSDKRRKIHFSVNPLRLAKDGEHFLDEESKEMVFLTELPSGMYIHREACVVRGKRYRIDEMRSIVQITEGFRKGAQKVVFGFPKYVSFDEFIKQQQQAYRERRISRALSPEDIPLASDDLLRFLINMIT